jgi:hypothetical protein
MRKFVALSMVALLALTMAFAVVGCSGGGQSSTEAPPPATSTMPADTSMMPDTSMMAPGDTATSGGSGH